MNCGSSLDACALYYSEHSPSWCKYKREIVTTKGKVTTGGKKNCRGNVTNRGKKTMERKGRVQRRMMLRRFQILCSITSNQFLNNWPIKLFWGSVLMVWHRILMKAFIPWFEIFAQERLSVDVLLLRLQSAWQLHSSIMDIHVMQECWSAACHPWQQHDLCPWAVW